MPSLRIKRVDYTGFKAMARELARYSATTYEFTFTHESASVIKICALRAKVASAAAIRRDVKADAQSGRKQKMDTAGLGHLTINVFTGKGRTWFVAPGRIPKRGPGGTFRIVREIGGGEGWHLGEAEWAAFLLASNDLAAYIEFRTAKLMSRRGLRLLSWLQIGDQLGVPLSSVSPAGELQESIARGARGAYGRQYQNGTSKVRITSTSLVVTVRNESPLAIKNQGQAELDRAVEQRVRGFFNYAVPKKLLQDLQTRAVRWKGIFVSP